MWQLQYLRALELGAEWMAEADRERLARLAQRPAPTTVGLPRRALAASARAIGRTAISVAAWADPRPA